MSVKKTIKKTVEKVKKQPKTCDACNGTGLLDQHTLCETCGGTGIDN